MAATFESVLTEAKKLGKRERAKLISALTDSPAKKIPAKSSKSKSTPEDLAISALRDWVNDIEKFENPKQNSSAKTAERIRTQNERGHTL